jgi:hypothetical protein
MKTFLRNLDLFGYQINFMIDNREKYSSLTGSVFSIIYLIFTCFYLLSSFKEFINRENLSVVSNAKILPEPYLLNLSMERGLNLKFGLLNKNGDKINFSSILKADFQRYNIGNGTPSYEKIEVNECANEFLMCVNFTNVSNSSIYGYDYSDKSRITMLLNVYLKSEFKNNTASLIKLLGGPNIILVISYSYYSNDYENFYYPVTKIEEFPQWLILNINQLSFYRLDVSKTEFITDEHYLWNAPYLIEYLQFDFYKYNNLESNQNVNGSIFQLEIMQSRQNFKIIRSYQKIPAYLADITGLLGILSGGFQILLDYLNEPSAINQILKKTTKYKEFYSTNLLLQNFFKEHTMNKKSSDQISNKNKSFLSNNVNSFKSDLKSIKKSINRPNYTKSNTIINLLNRNFKITKEKTPNENILSTHLIFNLCSICCFSRKQNKIRNEIVDMKYQRYIDVITYIKFFNEIEFLKKLLFSQDSETLFDFCSKSFINLNKNNKFIEFKKFETNSEIQNLIRSYEKCKMRSSENFIAENLMSIFGSEISVFI